MRIALALIATAGIALAATIAGTQISTAQPETEADADRSGQIALATAQAAIATAQAAIATAQAAWAAWAITPPELTDTDTPTPTATNTPSIRPNKPINLKVVVNADGTGATVTWESGGPGIGGSCPVVRYDLYLIMDSLKSYVGVVYPASGLSRDLTGLTPDESYTIEIRARGGNACRVHADRAELDFTATSYLSVTTTPEDTATPFPTNTPDPSASATPTPTATNTPAPTDTPTATNTPDPAASDTPTPTTTNTPDPTATPSVRPNTPINLKVAVNADGTSATVSWASGGSGVGGNCPATRYDLTLINLTDNSVNDLIHIISPPKTTQTVTLTEGVDYNVQISTYGSSCNGFSESAAILSFIAIASITFTPTATPTVTNTPDPAASATPTPTATATNTPDPAASDTPTPTATATATPTPSIRPNPAAYISVNVAATGTSATVTWRPGGNGVGGNCPTTQYQVVLNVNGAWQIPNNGSVQQPNNGQPTLELTGLTSGDSYIVGVDAYGDVCDTWSLRARLSFTATPSSVFGSATPTPTATPTVTNTPDPSASATPTATPSARPNKPINLQVAVNAAGTGATVSWESGGSGVGGNCPTTRYDLTLEDLTDSSVNLLRQSITAPTTTQTVTLTAGNDYNVQVYALGISCETYSVLPANLSFTATASTTFLPSPTPTPTVTAIPTATATPTATHTPTSTVTNTPSPTATNTPAPTNTPTTTPTATATHTPAPTDTPTATNTPEPPPTNTPSPTATYTPRPTNKATAVAAARATESAAWKDAYAAVYPSDDYFKAIKALATAQAAVATAEAAPTPENN